MSDCDPTTPGTVPLSPLLTMQAEHRARWEANSRDYGCRMPDWLWPASGQCRCCGARVFMAPPWRDAMRRLLNVQGADLHSCALDWRKLGDGDELYVSGVPCRVYAGHFQPDLFLMRTYE